jgi:hypothetical protein
MSLAMSKERNGTRPFYFVRVGLVDCGVRGRET